MECDVFCFSDITIWDGIVASGAAQPTGDGEKGEVEPGMQTDQKWWLESFELDATILSATGYFNFYSGVDGQLAGDIFVAKTRPSYGTGAVPVSDNTTDFGYDYVIDINGSLPLYTASGFDMSFLGADQEFWTHLTLSRGNDSMMGHGTTPVPEPATLLLLGTGLVGLAGAGRKKFKNVK